MNYDELDAKIIQLLQGDLPLTSRPFAQLAQSLELSESELLDRIRALQDKGIIRRWGAVLRHQQAGYRSNAMVAWQADADKADKCGEIMAGVKEISHCYLREVPADFNYALFTMIHARDEQELAETIAKVSALTGLQEYAVLKSTREFKKVSMQYF